MSLIKYEDIKTPVVRDIAKRMCIAARTAPKGRGVDNLLITIAETDTIKKISNHLIKMADQHQAEGFRRDGLNILEADVIVLLATKIAPLGLKVCGLCGYPNCEAKLKNPDAPCAFNTHDLGIAVGSAVGIASDNRVDNRIMYSVGLAVRALDLLAPEYRIIMGIPLTATGKNPFFDRK
ncbi:MAG: ferredoxin [Candidatus Omnitrophica bacterium]|nr:ferredoxin [Candidatus Omnitrophota bacterium]